MRLEVELGTGQGRERQDRIEIVESEGVQHRGGEGVEGEIKVEEKVEEKVGREE